MTIEAVSAPDRDLLRPLRYLWRVPFLLLHVVLGIFLCAFILTWNRHAVMRNGREPFAHKIIRWWSTLLMRIFGLRSVRFGQPLRDSALFVANHTSWIDIELLHTPGHTPGSQCFLLDGRLIAGDTLFLEGCGRTDFPGGDSDEIFRSLQKLAQLSGDPTVFPGHWYSVEPSASLSEVKRSNYVYRVANLEQWRTLMGG